VAKTTLALAALCALAAAGRADDPEPPGGLTGLRALKGTWVVSRALYKGREVKVPPGVTYAFDGAGLTWTMPADKIVGERKQTFRVKVNTAKKPHTIELVAKGEGKGTAGVYKVEKGELRLSIWRPKGANAPKDLSGDEVPVLVMEKQGKAKE